MRWFSILTALFGLGGPLLAQAQSGASSATLYPGQTGNSVQITVANQSSNASLTGVRLYVPQAPAHVSIDSIAPASLILEPGRSDTFTVTFSVSDTAAAGQSETITFKLSADQDVEFDFPAPQLVVSIGDSGAEGILASLRSRLESLKRIRAAAIAARQEVKNAGQEAQQAGQAAVAQAGELEGIANTVQEAQSACGQSEGLRSSIDAAIGRMERLESLVDASVKAGSDIAQTCQTTASARRINELYGKAEEMTVQIGLELASVRADAMALDGLVAKRQAAEPARERAVGVVGAIAAQADRANAASARVDGAITRAEELKAQLNQEGAALLAEIDRVQATFPPTDAVRIGQLASIRQQTQATMALPDEDVSGWITVAQDAAVEATAAAESARGQVEALQAIPLCEVPEGSTALVARAENAYTGALIHLGAAANLPSQAADCVARATPPPLPDAEPEPGSNPEDDDEMDDFLDSMVDDSADGVDQADQRTRQEAEENATRIAQTSDEIRSTLDGYQPPEAPSLDDFMDAVEQDRIRRGDPSIYEPRPTPSGSGPTPESPVHPDSTILGQPTTPYPPSGGSSGGSSSSSGSGGKLGPTHKQMCDQQYRCMDRWGRPKMDDPEDIADFERALRHTKTQCMSHGTPNKRLPAADRATCVRHCTNQSQGICQCMCEMYR